MFDKGGEGTIDAFEIRVVFRVLGFDHSKSKKIDFDEFMQIVLQKLSEPQRESQLIRAFHMLDKDDDDMLSLDDLVQVTDELGEMIDLDELREIIMSARGRASQFDIHTKNVGMISLNEFIRAIRKNYED